MSEIIGLNGRPVRGPMSKGQDLATKDDVVEVVMYWLGPVTQALHEVMERQKALEDHLGFTYIRPVPGQSGASQAPVDDAEDENR